MNSTHSRHRPMDTRGFAHPARNVTALGIVPGMTVVDFGSGSGAYVLEIAERLSGSGEVFAVDVQRDLLRKTHSEAHKRGLKTVKVIWGDLEMPGGSKLPDRTCDLVIISNLLFQVEEKTRVLEEARRILKDTGRLAIIDWQDSYQGMGPIEKDVVDKDAALMFAHEAGFAFVNEFQAGAHHYGLIFERAT